VNDIWIISLQPQTFIFCHHVRSKERTVVFKVVISAVQECDNRDLLVLIFFHIKSTSLPTRVSDRTVIRIITEREQQPNEYYLLPGKK
jgi:hypothetical protein